MGSGCIWERTRNEVRASALYFTQSEPPQHAARPAAMGAQPSTPRLGTPGPCHWHSPQGTCQAPCGILPGTTGNLPGTVSLALTTGNLPGTVTTGLAGESFCAFMDMAV